MVMATLGMAPHQTLSILVDSTLIVILCKCYFSYCYSFLLFIEFSQHYTCYIDRFSPLDFGGVENVNVDDFESPKINEKIDTA